MDIKNLKVGSLKGQNLLLAILVVLLVIAVLFIAVMQIRDYNARKLQAREEVYQQGMQRGYEIAVKQLMEQLSTCNKIPLFADNVTMDAVAVECLQE